MPTAVLPAMAAGCKHGMDAVPAEERALRSKQEPLHATLGIACEKPPFGTVGRRHEDEKLHVQVRVAGCKGPARHRAKVGVPIGMRTVAGAQ